MDPCIALLSNTPRVQARKERQLHMQMYPGWSARDNYAQSKEVDFITSKVNITTNIITIFQYYQQYHNL